MEEITKVTKELKEYLADAAISFLKKGEDYEELAYTTVKFAYIYLPETGMEALYKVITDKGTFAFGVEKDRIIRLMPEFLDKYDQYEQQKLEQHGGKRFDD